MDYECVKCPVCGSDDFEETARRRIGEDIFRDYKCRSCDETFSSRRMKKSVPVPAQPAEIAQSASSVSAAENCPLSARDIFRQNSGSVLELICRFLNCRVSGSGIVLPNNYVLTNAHVLFDPEATEGRGDLAEDVFAKNGSGAFELEFVTADFENDIALLHADRPIGSPVQIANRLAETGEKIYTLGNSKGEGLCIAEGIVSDAKRTLSGREVVLISAIVTHGNSGGPLLCACGELLGMVTNGRKDAVGMNYAVPAHKLLSFLREAEEREEIKIL